MFRTNYICFDILCTQLWSKILIINISIVLNNKTLENIKKQYKFVSNTKIFKISLNKSKIYLQFNFIKYIEKYIKDLQYILLAQVKNS